MSYRYWHIKGDPEEREFCYTTTPLYVCRFASVRYEVTDMASGEKTIVERPPEERVGITFRHAPSDDVVAAAAHMGMDPSKLAHLIRKGHFHAERARVDGKLTDRCSACGRRMENKGCSAYVQRPRREDEDDSTSRVNRRLSEAMGFGGPMVRLKGVTGLPRKDAKQWAYDEYLIAKAALAEGKG